MEREYFNIDHERVYMGILVHRSFPTEEVNGVAITKNLYRAGNYGFVINAQLGDQSVVKPNDGVICDQLICYPQEANELYNNKNDIDVITISNLNNGNLTMTEAEIQNLADQLDIIKQYFNNHFYPRIEYLDFGLDIEFKLDGEQRVLYIKQVRFFND
jgi:phosphoenolpyruvate synthase/pyruvate phosphate dikinase